MTLNISGASDRVWHKALVYQLPSFGFPLLLLNVISSFLSNPSTAVKDDGWTSSSYLLNSGVPRVLFSLIPLISL